jgi:hypothetical protein
MYFYAIFLTGLLHALHQLLVVELSRLVSLQIPQQEIRLTAYEIKMMMLLYFVAGHFILTGCED